MTTFATIGMSARQQPHSPVHLELHFSAQGRLTEVVERSVTRFLANMANYPWDHGLALDWWQILRNPGPIPAFACCSSILLHPRFTPDGWDHLHYDGEVIHLLNVVPITEGERTLAASSRKALLDAWNTTDTDIFLDRTKPT